MIAELDRYQGVVIRQILVAGKKSMCLGAIPTGGRVDAFYLEPGAFQIKHSSKRLSPWQFTYMPDNLKELAELKKSYAPIWVVLVCGQDGTVALSFDELKTIINPEAERATWVRVSRSRKGMYWVTGAEGELPNAKPKGVEPFLSDVFESM